MLPFLVYLTLITQKYFGILEEARLVLAAAFSITFISDFIDGRLARMKKLETHIGKILDSASDYLLLGITVIVFFYFDIISTWLFSIIIIRLIYNVLITLVITIVYRKLRPQTTFFGKIAIAAIMVLLALKAANIPLFLAWIPAIETIVEVLIGISVIDKTFYLVKRLKEHRL